MNKMDFLSWFGIYLIFLTIFGWWVSSRKKQTGEDFLLAGRNLGPLLLIGTVVATCIGTGSTMGAVGTAYSKGFLGATYGLATGLGILATGWLFSDSRTHRFVTLAEEVAFYYGANRHIKAVIGVMVFLASVGYLGGHIVGGGMYLAWASGIDLMYAKIIIAFGFALFTVIGGYVAVVWTDTIMAVVLLAGFCIVSWVALQMVGGLGPLEVAANGSLFKFGIDGLGWGEFLAILVPSSISIFAVPSFRQRIYSGSKASIVKKSFYISGIAIILFSLLPATIGVAASILTPGLEKSNFAFPQMAAHVLTPGLGILILISGLSATISSASSDAMTGTSILVSDVYKVFMGHSPKEERIVHLSRLSLIITTLVAIAFTLYADDILNYLIKMLSTITTGMAVCILLGKFWPRATWQGGVAAIIGGAATSLAFINISALQKISPFPGVPALIMAVVCGVLVSLMTKREEISEEQALKILESERSV